MHKRFTGNPRGRAASLRQTRFRRPTRSRALNAGGTNTVGAVIPTINHAIFAAFLEALEAGLDANGYRLLIATTGMDRRVELERARSLLEMGARALIVTGLDHEPELTGLAKRFGAPVVATSIYEASASMPTIGYDDVELGRQAMRHLLDLGHRDVALVSGPTAQNDRAPAHVPVAVLSLPCASGAKPARVCGVGAGTMSLAPACEDRRHTRQA